MFARMLVLAVVAMLSAAAPAMAQVDLSRPLPVDDQTICMLRFDDLARRTVHESVSGVDFPAGEAVASLGRFGGALSCDGVGGWVDVPNRPDTAPPDGMTVECWVKFRSRAAGDIICRNGGYMMRIGGSVAAMFHVNGGWATVRGTTAIPVGRWTHLAMTYDRATRRISIYIDGRLDVSSVASGRSRRVADPAAPAFAAGQEGPGGAAGGRLDPGSPVLRIGANDWSATSSVADALLDEVRVSSVARTYAPMATGEGEAPIPGDTNLVGNPSFESGIYGWRMTSEGDTNLMWHVETGDAVHGRSFLRASVSRPPTIISYPFRIEPGHTYTVSAAIRAASPCRGVLGLRLVGGGRRGAGPARADELNVGTAWQRFSATYEVPADLRVGSAYVELGSGDGTPIDFDAVSVVIGERTDYTQTDAQSFGLDADLPPFRTYMLGPDAPLPLRVTNTGEARQDLTVECTVTDWLGREVSRQRVPLGALLGGGTAVTQAQLPHGTVGWFNAHFAILDGGRLLSQTDRIFNVIEPMKNVGDVAFSPLGMNTHVEREPTEHLSRNMEILSLCGVKWIRAWWGWGMAEKEPGQFDWTEYDRQLQTVHDAGMEIMPILLRYYQQFEQAWAGQVDRIQRPPYDLNQWASFVHTTADHYRGRVKVWEVWNEANYTMDPAYYAELVKVTYEQIKAADPVALVVGFGGVSPNYMQQAFQAGCASDMDIVSVHSYGELTQPFGRMANLAAAVERTVKEFGATDIVWHTEQGTQSDGVGYRVSEQTEEQCAVNLVQSYLSAISTGAEKFFWFSAQTTPTYGWAIYYESYVPRPRLVALNGLARVLKGRRVTGRAELADGRIACVLTDGEAGAAAALWNLGEIMTVRLPEGTQATWTDMLCNPIEPERPAGTVELRLGRPLYVITNTPGADQLLATLRRAEAAPREPLEVTASRAPDGSLVVRLRNVSVEYVDARLSVGAPALFAAPPEPVAFADLAPGTGRALTFQPATVPAAGTKVPVTLQLEVGGKGIRTITARQTVDY